jgi:hypothetical protein
MTEMFKGEPDNDNQPVPPYEGRKESAEIGSPDEGVEDGADVGGARRPTENDRGQISPEPASTPRGEHASPADEQPAEEAGGDEPAAESTGPAHVPGTPKGERQA